MPDHIGKMNGHTFIMSIAGQYKPGDMPPAGYCDWHEWAKVQHRAGLRQVRCDICSKWKYPQEVARTEQRSHMVYISKKHAMSGTDPIERFENVVICKECNEVKEPT